MSPLIQITKALADENRVRIVGALRGGPLCVCQIVGLLGLADSTTSKHLSILRHAGLLQARKDGRWIYYRLARKSESPGVRAALDWILGELENDPVAARDEERLREMLGAMRVCEEVCEGGAPLSVPRRSR